jgi:23S rRNA U2552 (ribose-2'-O)-methylase RlmE/FtsJ
MAFRATRIVVASQKWGEKTLHDVYFKKAKAEVSACASILNCLHHTTWKHTHHRHDFLQGYVSRAAYKLKEIQDKHKVIKRGGRVLDLG